MISWLKKRFRAIRNGPQAEVTSTASLSRCESNADGVARKKAGDDYFDQGNLDFAAQCYQHAIKCDPNYAEAHNNLSNVYRERNLFDLATFHLKEAIRIKPDFANFHYNLASLQMAQGNWNDAIEHFRNTLKCNPDHHAARVGSPGTELEFAL